MQAPTAADARAQGGCSLLERRMRRRGSGQSAQSLELSLGQGKAEPAAHAGLLEGFFAQGYKIGASLRGGSGSASLRVLTRSEESVLLKAAKNLEIVTKLANEYNILKMVRGHANVVQAHGWHESAQESGFAMSFHGSLTLHRFYSSLQDDVAPLRARHVAQQLLSATSYLHSQHVVHRDLHSRNVIVEPKDAVETQVVIIDFGSASVKASQDAPHFDLDVPQLMLSRSASRSTTDTLEEDGAKISRANSVFAGEFTMPLILPPEEAPQGMGDAFERDCFALGLLISGLVRCKSTHTRDVYDGVDVRRDWAKPAPAITPQLEGLILGLVHISPSKRLQAQGALESLPEPQLWFEDDATSTISI